MRNPPRIAVLVSVCVCILAWPGMSSGYPAYRPPTAQEGCSECHSGFIGRGPLHDMHVGNNNMTNTCLLCHTNTGDVPQTFTSGDPAGQGCRGCHGIDNGTALSWGAGLRLHHKNAGVPADINGNTCVDCHTDPPPPPEGYLPTYYSRSDVNVKDPCDSQSADGEDYSGDGAGLDNDGDLVYDESDPDCATATDVRGNDLALPQLSISPNPVAVGNTTIFYRLPARTDVRVTVTNMAGRAVLTRRHAALGPGPVSFQFDGRDDTGARLPSGVYVVRIDSPVASFSGRLIWIK